MQQTSIPKQALYVCCWCGDAVALVVLFHQWHTHTHTQTNSKQIFFVSFGGTSAHNQNIRFLSTECSQCNPDGWLWCVCVCIFLWSLLLETLTFLIRLLLNTCMTKTNATSDKLNEKSPNVNWLEFQFYRFPIPLPCRHCEYTRSNECKGNKVNLRKGNGKWLSRLELYIKWNTVHFNVCCIVYHGNPAEFFFYLMFPSAWMGEGWQRPELASFCCRFFVRLFLDFYLSSTPPYFYLFRLAIQLIGSEKAATIRLKLLKITNKHTYSPTNSYSARASTRTLRLH